MPTTQEAIARLRMIFETQGADAAAAEMKKLEASSTSLGTSSLNLDRAFSGLERRYSETARATAEYERSMRTLNAALAQNPALAERAAAVSATVTARYEAQIASIRRAAQAQTAFGQVNQTLQGQMQGLVGSTGTLGSALSVMGRGGLAVAAGIGAAVLAFHTLNDAANNMAKYATDVKRFAEATGLSTEQVQGLNKAASKFGIDGESLQRFVMRFTAGFEEMRSGAGGLFESIRKVDAGLAEQMRSSEDETEALQKLITAIQTADTVWQKAALARAAGAGKGAAAMVPFLSQLDVGGLTAGRRGLSEELIQDLDKGRIAVEEASREMAVAWNKNWAAGFLEFKRQMYETGRDLLNMPSAVKSQVKQSTTRASDEDTLKVLDQQEQILIARLQEMTAQASVMGDENSSQFRRLTADAERLRKQLEEVREEQAKIARPEAAAPGAGATAAGPAVPPTLGQMKSEDIVAASNRYKELQGILGGLIPVAQQVEEALRQIELAMRSATTEEYKAQILGAKDALIALKTVQAEMSQVDPDNAGRQREQIRALKEEYPGLVAQDALRLRAMEDQLRVAQAITGAQRLQAQQQAAYNQLEGQGVAPELAMTMAKKQTAISQAQINAQAQQQLLNLQNQAGVAAAVTGADKIRAQEQATINSLLQQGVSLEMATAIAAQERANAEAAVNAAIERQVISLNESTELIRAQTADMYAQAGAAQKLLGTNEMNVRTQQAYNQAIREGADEEHAAALSAATYNNLLAQRAMQIAQIQTAAQSDGGGGGGDGSEIGSRTSGSGPSLLGQAQQSVYEQLKSLAQAGSPSAKSALAMFEGPFGGAAMAQANMFMPTIQKAAQEVADLPRQQAEDQALEQLKSLQDQARIAAASSDEEKAQIQAQLTYESLIEKGVSATVAQQVADQQLANAMQELGKSVDANTSALQAQLDPIYTEGRAALRIGYYGEGSGGTMRTVTATGYANDNAAARAGGGDVSAGHAYMVGERGPELFVPGSSGMIVPNAAQRGADAAQTGNVIIINNNFPPGSVLGDRRTQYLAANSYGRAIKAAG